ncbi:hypothetical protein N799_13805 [Lysobacter arseniciresistens ZS79]|uniref:Uncharacterized protein n=1 Tax=Lysobacter arseniciresistens ZS79 TaxID=913325 RepID=A0A0A0F6S9_9GAMM|nr:hypothetical protein N799_13805 [Lysobacter arseniciresistens ZS79]
MDLVDEVPDLIDEVRDLVFAGDGVTIGAEGAGGVIGSNPARGRQEALRRVIRTSACFRISRRWVPRTVELTRGRR